MEFKMRKLKTTDLFTMSKILKKIGIKKELNPTGKDEAQFGLEMFMSFIENMYMAEEEFTSLFSSLLGITEEEFSDLPMEDTIKVIDLFKEQDGIKVFLDMLSK